jgi:starch synthase
MRIIHLTTEFAPIAKAGGLGDVLVGLARELLKKGQNVEIILPKYDFIPKHLLKNLKVDLASFPCMEHGALHANTMWSAEVEGCPLLLLEAHHPKNYFQRDQIYGFQDDTARFLYFSKACLEYIQAKSKKIDILHLHDWHTATASVLAKDLYNLPIRKIILTIHNAEYQGLCATWDLDAIGLRSVTYATQDKMQDSDHPHAINLLKGGIVYADAVNTVSTTYAKEILTPEVGGSLSSTFCKYKPKLSGILNGIDQILWNPATDPFLESKYEANKDLKTILDGKESARNQLRKKFDLGQNQRPWIGVITRIVPQKGPKLIEEGLLQTLELSGSFLLLGSSPIPSLQDHFNLLKKKYIKNKNVLLHFEYDEMIAHQIYAALDFLLMPSHFEPCGLAQLISMRYGTIPIVRKTGGLQDTVFEGKNGFVFQNETKEDLCKAMERAVCLFRENPTDLQSLIANVMRQNFSWEKPVEKYLDLYR